MTESGLLVLDKPEGMTSHDVVARVRRALGTRKVGHAGTLDPMATGVLLIGVGGATRLLGELALADKAYSATVRLGSATVTDDREGDVLSVADPGVLAGVTDEAIRQGLERQVGSIEQRPSAVSAIKVDGRRAYDRVRSGEAVDLPARAVTIASIVVHELRRDADGIDVDIDVVCSTGTYIRAIARDLGDLLGVGGHLTSLRRTRVGPFEVDSAQALADVRPHGLISMSEVAARCFTTWCVSPEQGRAVRLGQRIEWTGPMPDDSRPIAILDEQGTLLALASPQDGAARYRAVFAAPVIDAPAQA